MYYDINEAKKLVLLAGKKLLSEGLVARTWGNISARISDNEFVITPSGRDYESLTEEDLVLVRVDDCSYDGDVKPSSEKVLHAACYMERPDCHFIIHTHQDYASVLSVLGKDFEFAPCAAYALPGTKALARNVQECVANNPFKDAILLKSHGAVVLAQTFEEAFEKAKKLEELSKKEFESVCGKVKDPFEEAKKSFKKLPAYIDDYAQIFGYSLPLEKGFLSLCEGEDEWAKKCILRKNAAALLLAARQGAKPLGRADAALQRAVYKLKYSKLKEK